MRKTMITAMFLLGALAPARASESEAARESSLELSPPPFEKTAPPKLAAWASAAPVEFARRGQLRGCTARRLHEWLRVDCSFPHVALLAVRTLSSNAGGESLRLLNSAGEDFDRFPSRASVVFPIRRGDRRVIEILSLSEGYEGPTGLATAALISEQWIDGDPGPLVSVL